MVDVCFERFIGREERLQSIIRFNDPTFSVMFYRTNLLIHSSRVYVILEDLIPELVLAYGLILNVKKMLLLALVHDDAEIITGDIQLYRKEQMSPAELADIAAAEAIAIEKLVARWPSHIEEFSYRELLYHALRKDCLEAQLVSYADKVDGFCESLHELHAGNERFTRPVNLYVRRLKEFSEKFPILRKILSGKHSLLQTPIHIDAARIIAEAKYHTQESITKRTCSPHYDRWRELTVTHFGINALINKKES